MAKFKVGDKVVVVNAYSTYDTYKNGDTGVVVAYDLCPAVSGYVRREDGVMMNVYWSEVELIEGVQDNHGAEALRSSILDIRSKREALQKEILQLDKQEKEAIEKLKEQGFLLYEENASKEVVAATNKDVLYAEDIEEDVTNPENWKVGDIIIAITHGYNNRKGVLYKITESVNEVHYECLEDGFCKKEFVGKDEMSWFKTNYKFHSRPVK